MRTIYATTGLLIGCAFAYSIVFDWDQSGNRIVMLAFALGLAALVTLVIVAFMRFRQPIVQPPPETPKPPLSRTGNFVFYLPPGTTPQGLMPSAYNDQPQAPYHPSQLID